MRRPVAYPRLTTRPLDQSLCAADGDAELEQRCKDVLADGYHQLRSTATPDVVIAVVRALLAEALEAADRLSALGLNADVSVVTSADRLWRAAQSHRGRLRGSARGIAETIVDRPLPAAVPITCPYGYHPPDYASPTFSQPERVHRDATDADGAQVAYAAPTATDDVDGPVPVSCVPASGFSFPLGETEVVCSASDSSGNSASLAFPSR